RLPVAGQRDGLVAGAAAVRRAADGGPAGGDGPLRPRRLGAVHDVAGAGGLTRHPNEETTMSAVDVSKRSRPKAGLAATPRRGGPWGWVALGLRLAGLALVALGGWDVGGAGAWAAAATLRARGLLAP